MEFQDWQSSPGYSLVNIHFFQIKVPQSRIFNLPPIALLGFLCFCVLSTGLGGTGTFIRYSRVEGEAILFLAWQSNVLKGT